MKTLCVHLEVLFTLHSGLNSNKTNKQANQQEENQKGKVIKLNGTKMAVLQYMVDKYGCFGGDRRLHMQGEIRR
jgi:hypothetical protein